MFLSVFELFLSFIHPIFYIENFLDKISIKKVEFVSKMKEKC